MYEEGLRRVMNICTPSSLVTFCGVISRTILVLPLIILYSRNLYLVHRNLNLKMLLPTKLSVHTLNYLKSLAILTSKNLWNSYTIILTSLSYTVIIGLTEGFWPCAEQQEGYPITHCEPQHPPKSDRERDFLISQRRKEIEAGRFSEPFNDLLPGMNVVPVHTIPKPEDKLCLIVDHSAGAYLINSMIDRQSISGVKLDGIKTLGDSIRAFRASLPANETQLLVLWKLDVAAAYRQMPMHPLWQIKQAVCIDDQFCIDRCNNFGGRASQKIWWSFISLVLWIAVFQRNLRALKCYVDDNFSFAIAGDLELYARYDAFLPSEQVSLLQLWDEINLPHEEQKQINGTCIPIIGFDVDPNEMTVTMSETKKFELVSACTAFTIRGAHKTLQEFQRLQGWVNWSLNVFPHLRPALCESYEKISGKSQPNAPIRVNNTMRRELLWFIDHVKSSNGIHMLKSVEWSPYDRMASTLIAYLDASGVGMGIWFPGEYAGFQCPLPAEGPKNLIFFYEALAICSLQVTLGPTLLGLTISH